MAKKKVARKPQDTTLRNNRARQRENRILDARVTELAGRVSLLERTLAAETTNEYITDLIRRVTALEETHAAR